MLFDLVSKFFTAHNDKSIHVFNFVRRITRGKDRTGQADVPVVVGEAQLQHVPEVAAHTRQGQVKVELGAGWYGDCLFWSCAGCVSVWRAVHCLVFIDIVFLAVSFCSVRLLCIR